MSENHWFQEICTAWAFAEILSKKLAYQDCVLKDGFSLNEHTELLRHYLLAYLKEKGSKGFLVEMASGSYGPRMLMMFLSVYEYAEDSKLKTLAKNIIDLWWATWAEEQINGASVNYHPEKLFDSPFVQSVWDSGMVHIRDGDEGLNLVFDVEQNRLRPKLL